MSHSYRSTTTIGNNSAEDHLKHPCHVDYQFATHWLQIVANIGLLVGLVFVGVQSYQDRQLKTAELIAASLQEHHSRNVALMGDDPASTLSKLNSSQASDERDQFIARAYFDARFANWSRNSILESLDLLGAAWSNGVVLVNHLWANQYGLQAVEAYLRDSRNLTDGLREQLSAEVKRIRVVYSGPYLNRQMNTATFAVYCSYNNGMFKHCVGLPSSFQ